MREKEAIEKVARGSTASRFRAANIIFELQKSKIISIRSLDNREKAIEKLALALDLHASDVTVSNVRTASTVASLIFLKLIGG